MTALLDLPQPHSTYPSFQGHIHDDPLTSILVDRYNQYFVDAGEKIELFRDSIISNGGLGRALLCASKGGKPFDLAPLFGKQGKGSFQDPITFPNNIKLEFKRWVSNRLSLVTA